jgi:hypothetical protein
MLKMLILACIDPYEPYWVQTLFKKKRALLFKVLG